MTVRSATTYSSSSSSNVHLLETTLALTLSGLVGFGWSLIAAVYGMFSIMELYPERTLGWGWFFRLIRSMAVRRTRESEAEYYMVAAAVTCAYWLGPRHKPCDI